jgi:hypothetical protein
MTVEQAQKACKKAFKVLDRMGADISGERLWLQKDNRHVEVQFSSDKNIHIDGVFAGFELDAILMFSKFPKNVAGFKR